MYRSHHRTHSASSSSTARTITPPLSSTSEDSNYEGIAWYQIDSVRRWREKEEAARARLLGAHPAPKPNKEHGHGTRDKAMDVDDDDDDDRISHRRPSWEVAESTPRVAPYSSSPGAAPSPRAARAGAHAHHHRSREQARAADADNGGDDDEIRRGPWTCPVKGCPKVLNGRDPKTWLRHLDSHWSHVYKRYSCPKCMCEFSRPESVMRHAASKASCADIRPCQVTERVPCWTNPAYAKFFDECSRFHPLYKTLHPVMEKARCGEVIEHPPWPILQPQIKLQ